ncbi:MAG: hypothetical protein FJ086_06760 [Deltaproteobacteria bacterium]|nr:hypothetical protein [Deltaproteobacteria bacterium]
MFSFAVVLLLTAAPDGGAPTSGRDEPGAAGRAQKALPQPRPVARGRTPDRPPPAVPGVLAPLGRYGDVVTAPPTRGVPAGDEVVVGMPPGCGEAKAVWLSRAVSGTARAAEQLLQWLETYPGEAEAAFRTGDPALDGLRQAVDRANRAVASREVRCGGVKGGWRLAANGGRAERCRIPLGLGKPGQLDFTAGNGKAPAARVRFAPGEGAQGCLPRLSVALFDDAGKVRVLVHADYAGAPLEVSLFGKRPQPWRLDPASQFFVPVKR